MTSFCNLPMINWFMTVYVCDQVYVDNLKPIKYKRHWTNDLHQKLIPVDEVLVTLRIFLPTGTLIKLGLQYTCTNSV